MKSTKHLENAMRTMFRSAGGGHVSDTIQQRQWSLDERAVLAAGVRDVLRYEEEEMPPEVRASAEELHMYLMDSQLEDRAEIIVRTPAWDLHVDRNSIHGTPSFLLELADEIASDPRGLEIALRVGRYLSGQETRCQLLRLLADRLGPEKLGDAAMLTDPQDWVAVSAALSATEDESDAPWVDALLERVADSWPEQLPALLRYTNLTSARLDFVLDQLERGTPAAPLGDLLYGARIKDLDPGRAVRLIRAVEASGRVEQSAGMLDQWLERNEERTPGVRELAFDLALAGIKGGGGSMVDYHTERWVDVALFDFTQLLAL